MTENSSSTARRFLRSTIASGISQGWRVLVMLGATLMLRRWIPVEDWGLFSWAVVIFMILGAVRDLGLAHHVMRLKSRPFGNLLLLEVLWGGALVIAAFVGAPAFAATYPEAHPEMIGVLRALTLFLFFEGLSTVPKFYFDSELAVHRALLPEVLRNLCFVGLSLGLAANGAGVWSLVIGQVAGAALYAALLWWRAWPEIPLRFERGKTLELVTASLPLAFIWFLIILTRHIDPLVLGLRFPFADIGHYTFAYEWATIASVQVLLPAVTRALYPALVALKDETQKLFHTYSIATRFVIALEAVAAGVLFVNAELVLSLVGGDQWQDAPTYLRILCFAPLLDPFSRLGGELLKARHLDRLWIVASLATVITFGVGGYFLTAYFGPTGMAWINLAPIGGLIMAAGLSRLDPPGFRKLAQELAVIYAATILAFAAVVMLPIDSPVLNLIASLAAAALVIAWVAKLHGAEVLAFFRHRPAASVDTASSDS